MWTDFALPQDCGLVPFFATSPEDTPLQVAWLFVAYACAWAAVWYACCLVAKYWLLSRLPPSHVASENRAVYTGQKLAALLKVAVLSGLANFGLLDLIGQPPPVLYGGYVVIEVAGVLFTSFEIADLVLCSVHRFLGFEDAIHHSIHIALGWLIRANCAPALTASVLIAQETSGLALNYFLLMRHRAPDSPRVAISFVVFFALFCIWRLGLGTFGTIHYLFYFSTELPQSFPTWQAYVLALALVAASVLQWYWGIVILRKAARKLSKEKKPGAEASTTGKVATAPAGATPVLL
eukprot:CAMPEP_0119355424 /NCGR_PEP_ID=MMETSP1334-20130426/4244_1 /TAXON_ID=127549 /ORGANISM="Calcidiscus leptoporus, Strain RCC1130" /LENGTH=292 /DNA_ID=CAMNT_0007369247 /DNA_START=92 /DNA_END=970 /DNA_ORIENTATION=-